MTDDDTGVPQGPPVDIRRQLLAVPPGRLRRVVLLRHFTDLAAEILGEPAGTVDPAAPLAALGFTSATTLELRTRLERSLGVTLPATLAWQYPTLEALAPHLAERMGIDLDPPGARTVPDTGPDPQVGPVGEAAFDGLSGTDLEALLLARIDQLDEGRR